MRLLDKKVLSLVAKIPKGKVMTYGAIARIAGTSPRAVGRVLGANPRPIIVPCHRVVRSDGSLGGYSGGIRKKVELLKKEGIEIKKNKIINLEKFFIELKSQKSKRKTKT